LDQVVVQLFLVEFEQLVVLVLVLVLVLDLVLLVLVLDPVVLVPDQFRSRRY
jgi:hypothetical protein